MTGIPFGTALSPEPSPEPSPQLGSRPAPGPLRIAVVTESFAPRLDEVADTSRHVVDGLSARGHLVEVVTGGPGAPSYRGIRVTRTHRRVPTGQCREALDRFAPDLVLAFAAHALGGVAIRYAGRLGTRSVTVDPFSLGDRADATLATTRQLRESLTVAGLGPTLWQPGVDLDEHRPELADARLREAWARGRELVVGHAGPLDRQKVVGRLRRIARLDGVRLVVLGAGPGADELRAAGAKISTAGCGLDLARGLASVDVVVQARRRDQTVPTVRKALASGTPVVGFDVGGTADVVVDGYNGLLVGGSDARMLARAVERLRDDPELRAALTSGARPSVARRSWADAVEELVRLHLTPAPAVPSDRSARAGQPGQRVHVRRRSRLPAGPT